MKMIVVREPHVVLTFLLQTVLPSQDDFTRKIIGKAAEMISWND
jgi:hypothetical protein